MEYRVCVCECVLVCRGTCVSLYVRVYVCVLCGIWYLPQAPWPWSVCIRKANSAIMMTALSFSFPISVSLSLSSSACRPLALSRSLSFHFSIVIFFSLSDLSLSLLKGKEILYRFEFTRNIKSLCKDVFFVTLTLWNQLSFKCFAFNQLYIFLETSLLLFILFSQSVNLILDEI